MTEDTVQNYKPSLAIAGLAVVVMALGCMPGNLAVGAVIVGAALLVYGGLL